MIDLDDANRLSPDEAGKADSVRPGALDAERLDRPEGAGPRHHLGIAFPVRAGTQGPESSAQAVDGDRNVHLLVGIHADEHGVGVRRNRRTRHALASREAMPVAGERTGL